MGIAAPALKVIGIALSAKTALEGIKERNLFKAVVGGVGAYWGMTSLAGGVGADAGTQAANESARAASQASTTAGAEIGDKVASEVASGATKIGGGAVSNAMRGAAPVDLSGAVGSGAGSEVAKTGLISAAKPTFNEALQHGAKNIMDKVHPGWQQGKGLIGRASQFASDNPELTQFGLSAASGYMEGKTMEEMIAYQRKMERERRERMGTPGNVGSAINRWNPETQQFERVANAY